MPLSRRSRNQPPDLMVDAEERMVPALKRVERDFERLYREVHSAACRLATHFVPDADSGAVVNEVALQLYRHWTRLPLDNKTPSYFLRRVAWRALDVYKREARLVSLPAETDPPADEGDEGEYRYPAAVPSALRVAEPTSGPDAVALVDDVSRTMPPQRRRVFELSRAGFEWKEIAQLMGIAEDTVKNHMTLARRQLKQAALRAGFRSSDFRQLPAPPARSQREEPHHG